MHRLFALRPAACLALLLLAPAYALAAQPAATTGSSSIPPRFKLDASSVEAMPQQSGRYTLRARFAPMTNAGELREGDNFVLIGRFAKGNVNCGASGTIFSNGFEGS